MCAMCRLEFYPLGYGAQLRHAWALRACPHHLGQKRLRPLCKTCQNLRPFQQQMLVICVFCVVRNMFASIVGMGHNIDMRGPCAPGPYHPGPIDCDSLNTFQPCVRFNKQMKKFMFCTCVRFNKKMKKFMLFTCVRFNKKMKKFMFCTCVRFNKQMKKFMFCTCVRFNKK
jgi:hypothetical protein